jgi:amidase
VHFVFHPAKFLAMTTPTVKISKDQHIWKYEADMKPVVSVNPGTVIEIETWDCFTGQVQTQDDTLLTLDMTRVNSATGPIEVIGAEPGDSLSVTLIDIQPGPKGAGMVIPDWGQLIDQAQSPQTRIFNVKDGVITMESNGVTFPTRPMFGVIGVAPAKGEIGTFFADRHGGNMDDHLHGIGATIHLPVFQPGGMLAIGDMHASMGDGEISGTGVEIGGKGIIKVDLVKGNAGGWPVTELADSWVTHGTATNIQDALKIACEEAAKLLVDEWGFTIEDAFIFLSVAGDLGIAQNCHPLPGDAFAVAKMRVPRISRAPKPFKNM